MASVVEDIGKRTIENLDYIGSLNIQLWSTLRATKSALPLVGNRYRWQATARQILQIGYDALPMISLMALCTGFILDMQGATELRRFGAQGFVIDLVVVAFTRELGPLLTATAVSGRSGSAFAAEIGTMKVTEELDSLRVMLSNQSNSSLRRSIWRHHQRSMPERRLQFGRNPRRRAIHVFQFAAFSLAVLPLCDGIDSSPRRGHRPNQEHGLCHHHCARQLS
jgi:Permease MlaE